MEAIQFNKPYLTGKELHYIQQAVASGRISGDGMFTKKCHAFFEHRYGFKKCMLTSSCTDALEMAAILIDIKPGDEVIMPSYTFVSTATAFVLRGANIVFCDSRPDHPGIDEDKIEALVTERTRAIVPVHYAGVACDMDKIMDIALRHNLYVVEDAAHAIESFYTGGDGIKRPLGSIGHLAAFSFHDSKNIMSGEGGLLTINDDRLVERAEIIREKGTNRSKFLRGELDKYQWVDIGSSFLPSDIIAAFLYAQLENLDDIQNRRISLWELYRSKLAGASGKFSLPYLPPYATNNAHIFYLVCNSHEDRTHLINKLKEKNIPASFHYLSLHASEYYKDKYSGPTLPQSDRYTSCLVRLPMFYELTHTEIDIIVSAIREL